MSNDFYSAQDLISATAGSTALSGLFLGTMIFSLILSLIMVISYWKVFVKAGKPGWATLIPIYFNIVLIEIAKLPLWYLVLYFIPFANIYVLFKVNIEISKRFGKTSGFGIGLTLLPIIFIPLLAFSDDKYEDTNISTNTDDNNQNSFDLNNLTENNVSSENNVINQINSIQETNVNIENNIQDDNSQTNSLPINEENNNVSNLNVINTPLEMNNEQAMNKIEDSNTYNVPLNNDTATIQNVLEPQMEPINQQNILEPQIDNQQNIVEESVIPDVTVVENNITNPVHETINRDVVTNIENISNNVEPEINSEVLIENVVNESKKVCKNCGIELPSIVSICPSCGTENE